MAALRLLLVFLFWPMVTGCLAITDQESKDFIKTARLVNARLAQRATENECILGVQQTKQCYYVVTITNGRYKGKSIGGKTSKKVCDQNWRSGNPGEVCDGWEGSRSEKFFPVKGKPELQGGVDYEFISQPPKNADDEPTAELICVVMDDKTGQWVERCVPRTVDLPTVNEDGSTSPAIK